MSSRQVHRKAPSPRSWARFSVLLAAAAASVLGCSSAADSTQRGEQRETASTQESLTTSLGASADTYVRDGSSATANFGTSGTLAVKKSTAGFNRESYLRFGLSSFTGSVQSAKLRVFGSASSSDAVSVVAQLLRDNSFTETGTTYNSKPESLPIELARVSVTGSAAAWYEFDVTSLVREKKRSGSGSIEFVMRSEIASNSLFTFNSKEAASNAPQLVVNTATALLVVGNTTLNAGDAAVSARLNSLGFAVTTKAATASTSADATGKSLIVVSSTVTSGDVNTKFRDVAVPVVTWENGIYDDMKMTGLTAGTDYGTSTNQTNLTITNDKHALAAGRQGSVNAAASTPLTFGVPSASALKIAVLPNDASKSALFAYEKGATMVGTTAPARRVGLFLGDSTAASLTRAGWALFDAATNWASGSKPFTVKKVYVINYDPILEAQGGVRTSQFLGFGDGHSLVQQMVTDMAESSGDYIRYQVTNIVDRDEWPLFTDGFRYTDATYLADWNTQTFHDAWLDIPTLMSTWNFDAGVNAGTYDEVFIVSPRGNPLPESFMVGPNAWFVNGEPVLPPATAATRNYMVMGLEPTRPAALLEHSFVHRLEWTMRHVYSKFYGQDGIIGPPSNWNTTPYDQPCSWANNPTPCAVTRRHFWDNFTLVDGVAQNLRNHGDATAVAGVGTAHFVPNATDQVAHNYDYGQFWMPALSPVLSNADDWLYNFPNLTGEKRLVSPAEWPFESSGEKEQSGYMLWFNNHVPRVAGRYTDSVLNNWWEYVVNYNDYPEAL